MFILRPSAFILAVLILLPSSFVLAFAAPPQRLEAGLQSFRERRFQEAMAAFLDVLESDPGNAEARRWQSAALAALIAERSQQARQESLQMLRGSLRESEKDQVVWGLCREAYARIEAGDLLAASESLYQALDLQAGHGEARRGFARLQALVRSQVAFYRMRGAFPADRVLRDAYDGLDRLNSGEPATALPLIQRALAASNPGEPLYARLQQFESRARLPPLPAEPGEGAQRAGEGQKVVPPPPPPPLPAPRIYGPPTPETGMVKAPFPMKPKPAKAAARKKPAAEAAPAAAEGASAGLPIPSGALPLPSDSARSSESYLRGVTEYMAGRPERARAAMREALRHDPDNTRARKMLERIEKEIKESGRSGKR